jgi:hypothetical protein
MTTETLDRPVVGGAVYHDKIQQGSVEKYARLTLVYKGVSRSADKHIESLWACDCGKQIVAQHSRVRNGYTLSCGCLARERSSIRATKHGGRDTAEYSSWTAMKQRCLVEGNADYPRYGGSGVTIFPLWIDSFAEFLGHIGPRPQGTTLDRIDGTLGYKPGNVRWATAQEQGRNRRGTYVWHIKGQSFPSIGEAASAFAVSTHTVWRWVKGEFDERRGKFTPPRSDCFVVARYAA